MRGPAFAETISRAVDRIRRMTGADVLLMTANLSAGRRDTMAELAEAAREVAREGGRARRHREDVSRRVRR